MLFERNQQKRISNLKKHGLDFIDAYKLWETKRLTVKDDRKDYGETRWISMGEIGKRVMLVVYTEECEEVIRIISFRKANKREVKYYEKFIDQR